MAINSEVLKERLRDTFGTDSQETVGNKLSMTQGNVSKLLSGTQQPTLEYGRIIARYSPTGEENYFGQFEFSFESGSAYTADMLEAVAMQVYVLDGKIVKVDGYDV